MKDNIQRPYKGLHTDSSNQDQPKDTYRFALNAVNETELGDLNFIGNEESNEECAFLSEGFVPIGKVYIGNNEQVIFSVNDTVSEIGVLKDNCSYVTHVNDASSIEEDKLGFRVTHQIDAIFRLRQGCKRTIYWVDDLNRPRYYDLDSPEDFQNDIDGSWNQKLFSLQKEYETVPRFEQVTVLDSGGNLLPGSYNFAIQYVDESLNPTEWVTTSPTVKIYNDLSGEEYREINGSITSDEDYLEFPATSKAIRINLGSLDPDFLYYRVAIIESNNGSGQVSSVKVSNVIPTTRNYFIYTGTNAIEETTPEEIAAFSDTIYKAKNIEQLENRLLLGNTQGKQVNFCNLQRYASRIKADCITKTVTLNSVTDPSNPKNPIHEFDGLGYMPGEIYSFGIVYVFEDGYTSPVYHIPGKSPEVASNVTMSPGENVYPMSNDNQTSSTYTDNDTCGISDYWGRDSEGDTLVGKSVRHHRFPLRSDIGIPLVSDTPEQEQDIDYWQLILKVSGEMNTPVPCPPETPDCGTDNLPSFDIRVRYTVEGAAYSFTARFDPNFYANGDDPTYTLVDQESGSQYHSSNVFSIVDVQITDLNNNFVDITSQEGQDAIDEYFASGFSYETNENDPRKYTQTVQGRVFTTQILGIKFSNIDVPVPDEVNGEKIVGYYIVRNERTEFDKTILDTGVLTPSVVNNKYISHGLLQPEISSVPSSISPSVYGLIHPEHKFNGKEYVEYDEIIQQGNFDITDRKYGKFYYNDVYDGTSFNSDGQKRGNDDGHAADGTPDSRGLDGWCLSVITRDNIVSYRRTQGFTLNTSDIKDRFYLGAMDVRSINDNANDVYNIATDNQVGIINLEDGITLPGGNNLPYVVLKKNNLDSYSNFRTLPYYKETANPFEFTGDGTENECVVFGGDTYVTSMRYLNSTFWDNRVAERKGKSGLLKKILGAFLVIVGAVLAFFTGGASAVIVGAGIALIGAGALFASAGIKLDNVNRIYSEEYDKGLRQTTLDDWVDAFYNYKDNEYTQRFGFVGGEGVPGTSGPSDDDIEWVGDCITDLWFESSVNMSLRHHMTSDMPTFLDSPGRIESGNDNPINCWEFFGLRYTVLWGWGGGSRYPVSSLERHMAKKLLAFDETRNDNRAYIGLALGEYYKVNPDYVRRNEQKIYTHLPLEYDCCSECQEDFPHRVSYSEQSFQEELSDNYRIFLPNNYRDIPGETGEITNIFKIGNNLYIHTLEGLWQMPRNYQERVTDQIVSFIGTGSYFEVPPQKVIDDDTGNSAGLQHKWSTTKTPYGYFFISENEKKIYQFDGKNIRAISGEGMTNWFRRNIPLKVEQDFYNSAGERYPFDDNPSNMIGTGFISTYDSSKERMIFTKRDFKYNPGIIDGDDFELCTNSNGDLILFENFNQTIDDEAIDGWAYMGMDNCRMKFQRTVLQTVEEEREVTTITTVPNEADIVVHYDTSGSFDTAARQQIKDAVDAWLVDFQASNPDWVGNLYHFETAPDFGERWIACLDSIFNSPDLPYQGVDPSTVDIVVISFTNEHAGTGTDSYHTSDVSNPMDAPHTQWDTDLAGFKTDYAGLKSFKGISYPIVFLNAPATYDADSRGFIEHQLGAFKGVPYSQSEADALPVNQGFPSGDWDTLKLALVDSNPYDDDGLENYDWLGVFDKYYDQSSGNQIISPEEFAESVNELLEGSETIETEIITVEVEKEVIETKYIDGTLINDPVEYDNSWTVSYALPTSQRASGWVSWHSYIPNFYIHVPEKFYSWIHGSNAIWKHNKIGHYQTFYGTYYPHIVEYISLSNPVITRIWNHIRILTEAKVFDQETQEYYEERFRTFNKAILYNTRQCSGLMDLIVKDTETGQVNYIENQVVNPNNNASIIDRNEKDWTLNDFRDIRINYNKPIWRSDITSVQPEYYIDKVLNISTLDNNKDWTQLESFRDKYLAVRLIFDNFADTKLLTNYSVENEQQSFR